MKQALFQLMRTGPLLGLLALSQFCTGYTAPPEYDLVIANGRMLDPLSHQEGLRHIGIRNGQIASISLTPLVGKQTIDASELTVVPGFIDLDAHGTTVRDYEAAALDGVTTSLELGVGTSQVARWYDQRSAKVPVHYGVSVSHPLVRGEVMKDPSAEPLKQAFLASESFQTAAYMPAGAGATRSAGPAELQDILTRMKQGVSEGALGIGVVLWRLPGVCMIEMAEVSKLSAAVRLPVFVQGRFVALTPTENPLLSVEELLANMAMTGSQLHLGAANMIGLSDAENVLTFGGLTRKRGLPFSAAVYPETGVTLPLGDSLLQGDWQKRLGLNLSDLSRADTGVAFTAEQVGEEQLADPRARGILRVISQALQDKVVKDPQTVITSSGFVEGIGGQSLPGNPYAEMTHRRVLAQYVREKQIITHAEAVRKMSLLPAQILERAIPAMRRKGRLQQGVDADLAIYDPAAISDQASGPGFRYVIVGGTPVVFEGQLVPNVRPGQPVRLYPKRSAGGKESLPDTGMTGGRIALPSPGSAGILPPEAPKISR